MEKTYYNEIDETHFERTCDLVLFAESVLAGLDQEEDTTNDTNSLSVLQEVLEGLRSDTCDMVSDIKLHVLHWQTCTI